jgi:Glycosyltransferase WbsX
MGRERLNRRYEIAAYYFPGYHADPRCDRWHGKGWTEWELVKRAEARFPGHRQPKEPLWGHEDESDPLVMARKIAAAADHGLSAFLFDWYWYEDRPFLNGALDRGFLGARNNDRLRFALMWANHNWIDIHPMKRSAPHAVLMPGAVSRRAFDAATDHIVATYMSHPSYWRVENRPYFSFYELMTLVAGLGGVEEARAALESFRDKVRAAGLGELHLNAVVWGIRILPGEHELRDPNDMLARLGFDSVTSYVWIHHTPLATFPTVPYGEYAQRAEADWDRIANQYALPYFPNVTMGWDPSPRTVQSDRYDALGYPFTAVLAGNTPEQFGEALARGRAFLDRRATPPPILTINAWNEWTEGSYLEPDTVHGAAYLEAIARVFGAAAPVAGNALS